jgi:hypothetical protein
MDGREHLVGSRDGRMFGSGGRLGWGRGRCFDSLIFILGFRRRWVFRVLPAADIEAEDSPEEQG